VQSTVRSNGRIESVNTKIRLITRVAFGFKSPDALIALAMLNLADTPHESWQKTAQSGPMLMAGDNLAFRRGECFLADSKVSKNRPETLSRTVNHRQHDRTRF